MRTLAPETQARPPRLPALARRVAVAVAAAGGVVATLSVAPASPAVSLPAFGHSVVVDPQRLGGEPMLAADSKGNIYDTSIIGFSNHTSYLWKSEDGGESFDAIRLDLPFLQRPSRTLGGGDSALIVGPPAPGKTEDTLVFIDLEGLASFGTAFSFDGANTFENDNVYASGDQPIGDRQWGAHWRDPQGTDHYYNFFNGIVGGYAIIETTDYGKTWRDWKRNVTQTDTRSRPGPMFVDKPTGDLLMTWTVATGTTGGAGFTRCTQTKICTDKVIALQPNLDTNNTFATGSMDRQGNLYVSWSGIPRGTADPNKLPTRVYLSTSTNKGRTWTAPKVVSTNVPVASMPSIAAGDTGRVAVVYYGSKVRKDPNFNSGPWFPYMAQSLDALSPAPTWTYTPVSEHTNHINPICTAGLGCTIDPNRSNDRNLIDFFWVTTGPKGEAMVTWNDTAHQVGVSPPASSPLTMFAKQIVGPSLFADVGTLSAWTAESREYSGQSALSGSVVPENWTVDADGDARIPRHGPSGPGEAFAALDLTAAWVEPAATNTMRVVIDVADLSGQLTVLPAESSFYMVWWWADNEVHYAAAEIDTLGTTDCYAGAPSVTSRASPRWALYPRLSVPPPTVTAVGCALDREAGRISLEVPYEAVNASAGQHLYSVHGTSFRYMPPGIAANAAANILEEIDQTAPFTYVVGAARSQVNVATQEQPAKVKGRRTSRPLAATGIDDRASALAVLLLASGAALWRWMRRPRDARG